MQNIPRIYINEELKIGKQIKISEQQAHYLKKVMRTTKFLAFNNGKEFHAELDISSQFSVLGSETDHPDPSNALTLAFAPIKQSRLEEMMNMATQMGIARLQPILTDRTTTHHINWERIRKITAEAAEQSNRNSVPEIAEPIKFADFIKNNKNIIFADERFAHENIQNTCVIPGRGNAASPGPHGDGLIEDTSDREVIFTPLKSTRTRINSGDARIFRDDTPILIGPEGGFSESEFAALDTMGATGINLGKTILRAEVAAVVAIAKIIN